MPLSNLAAPTAAGTDALRLQMELALYRVAAGFPAGWPTEPLSVRIYANGAVWILHAGPPNAEPGPELRTANPLSPRERKVLEAIRVEVDRLGRRVKGREIHEALRVAGYRLGRSTLNETLAELISRGHLVNPKDRLGYGFPGQHESP